MKDNISASALIANYNKAAAALKEYLSGKISLIPDNPDITRRGHNCFMLNAGAITRSKDLILDPYYYDFESQKESILKILDSGMSFESQLSALKEIAESGKITRSGHATKFHPTIREKVGEILSEVI